MVRLATLLALLPAAVLAHPGHDHAGVAGGVFHQPSLWLLLGAAAALGLAGWVGYRRLARR